MVGKHTYSFFVKVNTITYANHSTRYKLNSCSSYYAEGYPEIIHFYKKQKHQELYDLIKHEQGKLGYYRDSHLNC